MLAAIPAAAVITSGAMAQTIDANNTIIFGTDAYQASSGTSNTALGTSSAQLQSGNYNTSLGGATGMNSTGNYNTSVGFTAGTVVRGNGNIAVGMGALNAGTAVALLADSAGVTPYASGFNGSFTGNNNIVFGTNAAVKNSALGVATDNTVVLGNTATATLSGSVALGSSSVASRASGVAGYAPASATAAQKVAISATTGTAAGVSVGDAANNLFRQITGVAAGTEASDAVNVAQLQAAASDASTKYYSINDGGTKGANYSNDGASGVYSLAAGVNSKATNANTTAVGKDSSALGGNSTALGNAATSSATSSVALGDNSTVAATAISGVAIGKGATTTAVGGVAVGAGSVSSVAKGVAGYVPPPATGAQAAAIAATTSTTGSFAVGDAATGVFRQISGVAAGTVDSDAVNVAQLKAVNSNVSALSDRAVKYDLNPDGTVNYNTSTLTGPTSTNGGVTGGTTVTNLHQGAVNATSTDAINGAQLYNIAGDTSTAYTTTNGKGVRYVRTNDAGLPLSDAFATGSGSTAVGYGAVASGVNSLAMGNGSSVAGGAASGVAVGEGAKVVAAATNGVAIGKGASTTAVGGVAVGAGSVSSVVSGVAGYLPPPATGAQAAAIAATTSTTGSFAVGDATSGVFRQISGVAAGTVDSDAVNVAQLKAVNSTVSALDDRAVKYSLNADGTTNYTNVTLTGPTSTNGGVTGGTTITNLHQGAVNATSTDAINGAQLYNVAGDTSTSYTTINGKGVRYVRTNDAGLPLSDAFATGKASTALGYGAAASAADSVAIGSGAKATTTNSVALGAGSATATAVGTASTVIRGTTYSFAGAAPVGTVSVGNLGAERTVTNVAAGRLTSSSTDAVNGSQLYATNTAINAIGTQVNTNTSNINNLYGITNNLDQRLTVQENTSVRYDIKPDGTVNYNQVSLGGGRTTGPVTLGNVADGVGRYDAVNKGQLDSVKGSAAGYAATAIALAAPPDQIPGKTVMNIGTGAIGGEAAIGISARRTSDDGRSSLYGGVATSTKSGAGVSAGYSFILD